MKQAPHRRFGWRQHLAGLGATVALLMSPNVARPAAAQNTGTIGGTVTETGTQRPIQGAQVFVAGTERGRLTDANGVFTFADVPAGTVVLRVESIGYRSTEQEVTVTAGGTATATFQLQASAVGLDEIVVTGTAGGQAKRTLGNSVGKIDAAGITEVAPISNVQQLLQGRTAGVTLVGSSGVVGGTSKIRIRGASSITAGNDPVVYVDGVRVSSGTLLTSGNSAQGISLLEAFNPADIESMEVIKGPAAATLYGAEAAAGVIQIITKKGRPSEGLQWTASFDYGETDWAAEKFATYWLCEDAHIANPSAYPGCQLFTTSTPREQRVLIDHPLDPDHRSEAVKYLYEQAGHTEDYPCLFPEQEPCQPNPLRTGVQQNLNLSVRGGGEAYNFYISGEKNDEDGTFFNNWNDRLGARANFGFVPSPKANFAVNVGYVQLEQQTPQSDNSSNSILRNSFRGQAGGPSSQYLPGFRNFMPEFSNKYNSTVESERLTMGVTGNYNPFSWWQNRLTFGLDRNDRSQSGFDQIDQTGLAPFGATAATGAVDIDYDLVYLWTVDYSGTLNANVTENVTSAFSAGMQLTKRRAESHGISGNGLVANQLNLVSAAANRSATQGFSEQTSLGFFVQEQVGWQDRLFATAAVRVDDNSAFGRDFSLVVYPKASLSWVISEEEFFNVEVIDELKLRAAWGQAGNAPAPFSADRTYSTGRAAIGDIASNTLSTAAFGNPDLKAETGQEIELGFDGSLLGGRMSTEFTYYYKQTKDALLSVSDPPSSGWTGSHLVNVGEIRNSGFELTIDGSVIQRPNFSWDVTATGSTNSNELVTFGKDANGNPVLLEETFGEFLSVQRHREGYPLGAYWSTDVVRDANGVPVLDANGAAILETCTWDPADRTACNEEYVGPMLPTRTLGLSNTVRIFNNLQLFAFFDYQGGNYQWCAICSVRTRLDRNSAEINNPNLDAVERARLLSLQTKEYIYESDFIKLRELSATYAIPRHFTERLGFNRVSATLSGRNLWMWTKYEGNTDPEVAFHSGSSFGRTDYAAIPMQRQLMVSLNFNF
jgi:TonB-dependent starch-binding outer membrane protein SusC